MRRRTSDNPVSRCLFPTTGDEGRNDNNINGSREALETEFKEKMKKWHYDFKNDVPLIGNGNVAWKYQNEKGHWIGEIQIDDEKDEMENKAVKYEPKDEETAEDVRMQNEVTPNPTPIKEVPCPPVRKRSREDDSPTDLSAKRKIL